MALPITISGNLTIGADALTPGPYTFTITLTPAAPPPPPIPPSVQVNGVAGPVSVPVGAAIRATVANGSGNPGAWLGVYAVGSPSGPGNPASWKWLSTDSGAGTAAPTVGVPAGTVHLAAPTQAGLAEVRYFPANSFVVGATSATITVSGAAAVALITVNPVAPTIPDKTPLGGLVATYTVTMSDGSPFVGTVAFTAPNFDSNGTFALAPTSATTGHIIVNPSGPGVGPNLSTITDHITLTAS